MKKIILLIIFLLTGCTSYEFQITENITEAKYSDVEIIKDDYKKIRDLINKNDFNEKKPNEKFQNTLTIKTKSDIYKFTISNNYINYNNHYSKNKELINYLEKLEETYYDSNFFKINHTNNYELNENDENILLDNINSYIILKLDTHIKDFKINLEEFNGHDYDDIDLLYNKDKINKNTIAIRKNLEKSIIRISFKNPYNYEVSIIVKTENNKVVFDTIYK